MVTKREKERMKREEAKKTIDPVTGLQTREEFKGVAPSNQTASGRFFISSPTGGREVSEEEFKAEKESAKILQEGGKRIVTAEEEAQVRAQIEEETTKEQLPEGTFSGEASSAVGIVEQGLGLAAQAADVVRSTIGLSGRKPAKTANAEQALSNYLSALDAEVQSGKSPSELRRNFIDAENALSQLEATQHGLNAVNLDTFLGGGAEIEAKIIEARAEIAAQRELLIQTELLRRQSLTRRQAGL